MITDTIAKASVIAIFSLNAQIANITDGIVLASHEISLEKRYEVKSVSDVFKDNILLNLAYMRGISITAKDINWNEVKKPFHYEYKLDPSKTFAFHEDVLSEYKNSLVKTTQAHFNAQEGFKTDGYLFGDGVCHLASLMYWVAKDAGLDAKAPTNHDFMAIPEISREYGVSIYSNPFVKGANAQQNLYITNNKTKPVKFVFDHSGEKLRFAIVEENQAQSPK